MYRPADRRRYDIRMHFNEALNATERNETQGKDATILD
jgi:hypothetical protein